MKRLGTVLHISNHGNLVVRGESFPKINSIVLTKRMKKIGLVYDIFGPIKSPYISVKPHSAIPLSELIDLRGDKVYINNIGD